jgi:hypothetical protein
MALSCYNSFHSERVGGCMDLNGDDIETKEEICKIEELIVHGFCYVLFSLPVIAILKIKVYDPYFPMIKNLIKLQ